MDMLDSDFYVEIVIKVSFYLSFTTLRSFYCINYSMFITFTNYIPLFRAIFKTHV